MFVLITIWPSSVPLAETHWRCALRCVGKISPDAPIVLGVQCRQRNCGCAQRLAPSAQSKRPEALSCVSPCRTLKQRVYRLRDHHDRPLAARQEHTNAACSTWSAWLEKRALETTLRSTNKPRSLLGTYRSRRPRARGSCYTFAKPSGCTDTATGRDPLTTACQCSADCTHVLANRGHMRVFPEFGIRITASCR